MMASCWTSWGFVKEGPAGLGCTCQASRVPGCRAYVILTAVSAQHSGQRGLIVLHRKAEGVDITPASAEMPSALQ